MSSIFGPEGVSLIPRPFLIIRRTAGDGKREGKERREGSGEWACSHLKLWYVMGVAIAWPQSGCRITVTMDTL